ncbi:GET4 protein, partial [Loxia curvirostra]|nr:GET4 protein [Loxia curvirostra]
RLVEYSLSRRYCSEMDMFVAQAILQFLCLKNETSASVHPSLKRDPLYNEYLDRIGQLFFGVPPKQTSSYRGLL